MTFVYYTHAYRYFIFLESSTSSCVLCAVLHSPGLPPAAIAPADTLGSSGFTDRHEIIYFLTLDERVWLYCCSAYIFDFTVLLKVYSILPNSGERWGIILCIILANTHNIILVCLRRCHGRKTRRVDIIYYRHLLK